MTSPFPTLGVFALGLALASCAGTQSLPMGVKDAAPQVSSNFATALRMARLQRESGDLDGAIQTLSQLVLFAPDDPDVLGEYGKVLVDKGEPSDALGFLTRAIELRPGNWSVRSAQGIAYAQSGDFRSAQTSFATALALQPGEPSVLNNSALAHLQEGNLDAAEAALLRASASGGTSPRIEQNLLLVRQLKSNALAATPVAPAANPLRSTTPALPPARAQIAAEVIAPPQPAPPGVPPVVTDAPAPASTVPVGPMQSGSAGAEDIRATERVAADSETASIKMEDTEIPNASLASAGSLVGPSRANLSDPVYIQIGAYASVENADRMLKKLETFGAYSSVVAAGERTIHHVRIGPLANSTQVDATLAGLARLGISDVHVFARAHETQSTPALPALRMSETIGLATD